LWVATSPLHIIEKAFEENSGPLVTWADIKYEKYAGLYHLFVVASKNIKVVVESSHDMDENVFKNNFLSAFITLLYHCQQLESV
jgi:hypothetical protein